MKLLLFLWFFTLTFTTSGQGRFTKKLSPVIRDEFKKIKNLGSDTILIYEKYCIGCETIASLKPGTNVPFVYEGFERGKIYWKHNNRYYSKDISRLSGINNKVVEMKGDIFNYFFSKIVHFKSIKKYKFNGKFLPPLPSHTSFERLSIYTPLISYQVLLAEQQKESTDWKVYEWILPSIEIMEMVERTYRQAN